MGAEGTAAMPCGATTAETGASNMVAVKVGDGAAGFCVLAADAGVMRPVCGAVETAAPAAGGGEKAGAAGLVSTTGGQAGMSVDGVAISPKLGLVCVMVRASAATSGDSVTGAG